MSRSIQDTSLMNQLISKIDITALENHKEITMELSPKELGNLSIKLTETNGFLVANIRVDNDKTKELLLNEIAQLKQMLESQGLSVGEVKVDIRQNQHQSEMEKQKQKSVKRIQELIDKHLGEDQEESMQVDGDTGELIETEVNYMV
jgi:flagellar hook-length control protein FliK